MGVMKIETPRKSLPSIDTLTRPTHYQLPPLSTLLDHSEMPRLPSISSLPTPSTPRFMYPVEQQSQVKPQMVPAKAQQTQLKQQQQAQQTQPTAPSPITVKPTFPAYVTPAESRKRSSSVANTLIDSEGDTSINDLMVKPATKRATTSPSRDFAFISHSPATYPSQEPSIDNASLARRKRRRTSPNELAILNQEFEAGQTPNKARRIDLARRVNMTEKAVKIWFQNKRQLLRRLKLAEREITELPPTPEPLAVPAESAPRPLVESTPIKPGMMKLHSQELVSPAVAHLSPFKSHSSLNLTKVKKEPRPPLLHRMLAAEDEPKKNLVLNLTNKKQPEFVRLAPDASNQVMTFKLAPSKPSRKPLADVNTNVLAPVAKNDSQCAQGLLSLRTANY